MEENEIESTESDVTEGSSSEASESSSESGDSTSAESPKEQEIDWSKAFEHPRFKELVDQKNDAVSKYRDLDTRYKQLETQLTSFKESQPKPISETDQLISDLKNIDPRLANVIESQLKAAETAKTVQARLEAFEKKAQEDARTQVVNSAVQKIQSLHESNKHNDFAKEFINNRLDLAYRNGKLDAGDLKSVESAYKEASDFIKKTFEEAKRELTKSYVQEKSKDSSVPASIPKGAQAKPAAKSFTIPKDKEALKAAIVKSYLKEQAANRDAVNT